MQWHTAVGHDGGPGHENLCVLMVAAHETTMKLHETAQMSSARTALELARHMHPGV